MPKILVVDDHPLFRRGIADLFENDLADASVLQAGTVPEALQLLTEHPDIDALLLDIVIPDASGLPIANGLLAIADFRSVRPDLPIIILSASEATKDVRQALSFGALGYVPKSASPKALLAAVDLVLNGEIYMPPLVLSDIKGAEVGKGRGPKPRETLTERQIEILKLVADGQANKEIAKTLELSEKTVKVHVTAIFRALDVVNRAQAVIAGREAQLI